MCYLQLFGVHLINFFIDKVANLEVDVSQSITIVCVLNFMWALATFAIFVMDEKALALILKTFFPERFDNLSLVENDVN
jgi:hypothetical protein